MIYFTLRWIQLCLDDVAFLHLLRIVGPVLEYGPAILVLGVAFPLLSVGLLHLRLVVPALLRRIGSHLGVDVMPLRGIVAPVLGGVPGVVPSLVIVVWCRATRRFRSRSRGAAGSPVSRALVAAPVLLRQMDGMREGISALSRRFNDAG